MYRVDRRLHTHKRLKHWIIGLLIVLVLGALSYAVFHLRITPSQEVHNSPPVSTRYRINSQHKMKVDKPEFTLELPATWKEIAAHQNSYAPVYSFQSPSADAQTLNVYIDNTPKDMGINRAVVVAAQENGLTHDAVSDNCATFTDSSKKDAATGKTPAKWQGTDFICDLANTSRDVIGTVSTGGINTVTVQGQSGAKHTFFMTFVDNNINPNVSVFYEIIESVHFK